MNEILFNIRNRLLKLEKIRKEVFHQIDLVVPIEMSWDNFAKL